MPLHQEARDRSFAIAGLLRDGARDGELWLSGEGASMIPLIETGDQLRIKISRRGPRLGEVWAFCAPDERILAHRYLGHRRSRGLAEPGEFVFRGDACGEPDAPVLRDQLVGRVIETRRGSTTMRLGSTERLRWLVWAARRRLTG